MRISDWSSDVRDQAREFRPRRLGMPTSRFQLRDAHADARSAVVEDRHLLFGIGVVAVRGNPIDGVIFPQRLPAIIIVKVLQTRFLIDRKSTRLNSSH